MCLGEESTKARILEHALTRFDVHVPSLLREAGTPRELAARLARRVARRARGGGARRAVLLGRSRGRRRGRRRVPGSVCASAPSGHVARWERGALFREKRSKRRRLARAGTRRAPRAERVARFSSSVERTAFQTETPGAPRAPAQRSASTGAAARGNRRRPWRRSPRRRARRRRRRRSTAPRRPDGKPRRRRRRRRRERERERERARTRSPRRTPSDERTKQTPRDSAHPRRRRARAPRRSLRTGTRARRRTPRRTSGTLRFRPSRRAAVPGNRRAAYVTDAPEDVRAVSRRASRARARAPRGRGRAWGRTSWRGTTGGFRFFSPAKKPSRGAGAVPPRARWDARRRGGALGFVADEDGESRSMMYVPGGAPGMKVWLPAC